MFLNPNIFVSFKNSCLQKQISIWPSQLRSRVNNLGQMTLTTCVILTSDMMLLWKQNACVHMLSVLWRWLSFRFVAPQCATWPWWCHDLCLSWKKSTRCCSTLWRNWSRSGWVASLFFRGTHKDLCKKIMEFKVKIKQVSSSHYLSQLYFQF